MIGTLKEKDIHKSIKFLIDSDENNHEKKIGKFHVDVLNKNGIFEVQTRSFYKLKEKIVELSKDNYFTIVFPISRIKTIIVINSNSGELIRKRKSPKKGSIYDFLLELYTIRDLVDIENLRYRIIIIDSIEYRDSETKVGRYKRTLKKIQNEPVDIIEDISLERINDIYKFLNLDIQGEFDANLFSKIKSLSLNDSRTVLNMLERLNIVKRIRKEKNKYIYEVLNEN
jgi:hypothetical protein